MDDIENQIEKAIRNRQIVLVSRLVSQFLQKRGQSPENRLLASEYFRRISQYESALSVLEPELERHSGFSEQKLRSQIQLARILNLLGASNYALRVLAGLTPAEKNIVRDQVVGIYVSNYRYAEALTYIDSIKVSNVAKLEYRERLKLVTLSDCHFGNGNSAEAIAIAEEVLAQSPEPLLKGIASQALASYYILTSQLGRAASRLEIAEKNFPAEDTTPDRGFVEKWVGAFLIKRGHAEEARRRLQRAWKLIFRPGYKPEAWLEILYWMGYEKKRSRKSIPRPWAQILAYPQPNQSRIVGWILEQQAEVSELVFGPRRSVVQEIHLGEDCVYNRAGGSGPRAQLSLALTDLLLAQLTIAQEFGIPQYRLYETLWPDELFNQVSHQKKLEQIVIRLRDRDRGVRWQSHHLKITESSEIKVVWTNQERIVGAGFLREHGEFGRLDLAAYFKLSPRSHDILIRKWLQAGAIEKGSKRGKYKTL